MKTNIGKVYRHGAGAKKQIVLEMSPKKGVGESTRNLNLMFLKTSHCHLKCNVHKDNYCIWKYGMNLGNKNVMTEVILCLPRWLSSGLSDSQDPRQFEPSFVQPKKVGFLSLKFSDLLQYTCSQFFLSRTSASSRVYSSITFAPSQRQTLSVGGTLKENDARRQEKSISMICQDHQWANVKKSAIFFQDNYDKICTY